MNIQVNVEDGTVYVDGVYYYQQSDGVKELVAYRRMFADMKDRIGDMQQHAQSLYDDYKREGLGFGMVEAEGYLRAAIEMKNIVDELEVDDFS